jgi:hypothetical protein
MLRLPSPTQVALSCVAFWQVRGGGQVPQRLSGSPASARAREGWARAVAEVSSLKRPPLAAAPRRTCIWASCSRPARRRRPPPATRSRSTSAHRQGSAAGTVAAPRSSAPSSGPPSAQLRRPLASRVTQHPRHAVMSVPSAATARFHAGLGRARAHAVRAPPTAGAAAGRAGAARGAEPSHRRAGHRGRARLDRGGPPGVTLGGRHTCDAGSVTVGGARCVRRGPRGLWGAAASAEGRPGGR